MPVQLRFLAFSEVSLFHESDVPSSSHSKLLCMHIGACIPIEEYISIMERRRHLLDCLDNHIGSDNWNQRGYLVQWRPKRSTCLV